MTQTSLYFVETESREQRALLCRWVERFYHDGRRIQVVTDSTMAAQHLDQMLWTFSDRSFVPHRISSPGESGPFVEPVIITVGESKLEGFEVLICDEPVGLDFMTRYSVVMHFVLGDDEEKKQASRILWQRARERGILLHHVSRGSGS